MQIGITLGTGYAYGPRISYDLGQKIGGPSAGLMFSLGIYDTLTPGSLTGGGVVAGTGTMDPYGNVGPIGGIQQKIAGARNDGAELLLVPADNCDEVVGHVPDGLEVVKIGSFDDALGAVKAIAANDVRSLPRC